MQFPKDKLVALDSNIFIYHFQANPIYLPLTTKIFKTLEVNGSKAVTSIITLIEVLGYKQSNTIIKQLEQAFDTSINLSVIDANKTISLEAARLRRDYNFKLPDAIQIATALYCRAKVFITNDERLKRFKELKVILLREIKP